MRLFHPRMLFIGLLLTALLIGCGQKGPLYLPESKAPPTASTPQNPPPKP
ncbi:MAG TPA: hypothetical protein DCS21_11530 [Gammaproteobacteria bacterium]|nr:hypothetical protein [Gammaproteobacteria bacterium]